MTTNATRTPSASPPPPTLSAPGPRATALQKLYSDAITHVLKTCSYANFAACFPTPAAHVPADLRDVHGQFVAKLEHWLRREFESLLLARDVVPSLNELDRLIEDARRRKAGVVGDQGGGAGGGGEGGAAAGGGIEVEEGGTDRTEAGIAQVPPHTLPPTQLYLSHLAPTLGMYETQMRERQDALAKENQALLDKVLQQRKDIEGIVGGLEKVVQDLSGSVEALKPGDMEKLRDETRSVDEMMR